MKVFSPDFFDIDNFILSQTKYYNNKVATSDNSLHICYNVNDAYIPIMGVSIISVLENNKGKNIIFHIFTDGYSDENAKKLEDIAKKWQCTCVLYQLNMEPFHDFHIKVERFSRITYARLYMSKVIKDYASRYIYLDADTMCVAPLDKLWQMDLHSAAMGAVSERASAVDYRAGYLHLKNGKYFNDGVMLVDVLEWEKQHITEKAFSYQCEPRKRFLGQSQDVLNLVFDGKNYFLPADYNVYDGGEYDQGHSVIVHWTGRRKPWQMVVSKFDEQWRKYNALSPWETITNIQPVKEPKNYHDFKYWGRYRKEKGYFGDYLKGMFWYSVLKIRYKLGI
ncbi:glycosyltransferase family 8 protein [uncultured Mitsuokella sp.]|uniref:glycosyltransferase family 8 protein n=1 Tax=uncultured Mitsuokella sp. TaxID=453120 RepID=UPI0025D792A6|nr:glycosyltransferase family 8 protein [uncultured Mitsuokella sp.]